MRSVRVDLMTIANGASLIGRELGVMSREAMMANIVQLRRHSLDMAGSQVDSPKWPICAQFR